MKKQMKQLALGLVMALSALQACKKDPKPNTPPVNESELITTVIIEATDSASGQKSSFKFKDADGEGGNAPSQFDSIKLIQNRTYLVNLILLDESKTAVDTISNEVLNEGEDHLFNFTVSNINLAIRLDDLDKNGLPIGLKSIWKAGIRSNGKLKVVLKHQPGIKNGDPTLGETDIEIDFNCKVE
jgi:hypothetical protein